MQSNGFLYGISMHTFLFLFFPCPPIIPFAPSRCPSLQPTLLLLSCPTAFGRKFIYSFSQILWNSISPARFFSSRSEVQTFPISLPKLKQNQFQTTEQPVGRDCLCLGQTPARPSPPSTDEAAAGLERAPWMESWGGWGQWVRFNYAIN